MQKWTVLLIWENGKLGRFATKTNLYFNAKRKHSPNLQNIFDSKFKTLKKLTLKTFNVIRFLGKTGWVKAAQLSLPFLELDSA